MKRQCAVLALITLINIAAAADPRSDGLPADMTPWWPSRYGAKDQLGTLNEITAKQILAAVRWVKKGAVVDFGRILDDDIPKFPGRYWHQTADATALFSNQRRPDADGAGWGKNRINWITENRATEALAARKVYQYLFLLTHAKTRGSTVAVIARRRFFNANTGRCL